MRCVIATTVLASAVLGGCALAASHETVESRVLAAAKHMAAEGCQPRDIGTYRVAGCKYLARLQADRWYVDVDHIMVDKNGNRVRAMGEITGYVFDSSGKFIRRINGM